jgi:glucokinase
MAGIAIGVDLGGTNARAAAVDRATGAIRAVRKERLADRSPEAVVEVVARTVREVASAVGAEPRGLGTVGIGVAGQCLGSTGVVLNAPNLGWRDVALGSLLERALSQKVRVANDLSVAAWGEMRFGAARGFSDVLLVFVGSGVGGAVILGGRLHEGARGVGGEVGHVKVRPSRPETKPRRCGCGAVGCLEAYTSGVNIAARVREELAAGAATRVREIVQGDAGRASAAAVEEAFGRGDAYAIALWEEVADLLGTAVANATTLLNPARVILGGGMLLGCAQLLRLVRQRFDAQVSASAAMGLSFERAHLGDDAGVIGAALLDG